MASKKPQSPAMEFLVSSLKRNPKASYADLRARAEEKMLKLFPIMFGRAQALLGIVKSAKRGEGKFARASAAARRGALRPGRPADSSSKSARVRALLGSGMSAAAIAKKVGCTVGLVYTVKSTSGGTKGRSRPQRGTADGLAGLLTAVKDTQRERMQLRGVLERLQGIVRDALGS
jgi:hypothetical protein